MCKKFVQRRRDSNRPSEVERRFRGEFGQPTGLGGMTWGFGPGVYVYKGTKREKDNAKECTCVR